MLVIGITGKKHNGKDTVADYLVKKHDFKKYALADTLKRGLKELFNLTDDQLWGDNKEDNDAFWGYSPRELMQIIGTDLIRKQFDEDFFVKTLKKKILEENIERVVISDIRFLNEANLVEDFKGHIIRVKRNINTYTKDDHCSENNLDSINFKTIDNNGTIEELHKKIDLFLQDIIAF